MLKAKLVQVKDNFKTKLESILCLTNLKIN